jgi:hypothetical protein
MYSPQLARNINDYASSMPLVILHIRLIVYYKVIGIVKLGLIIDIGYIAVFVLC